LIKLIPQLQFKTERKIRNDRGEQKPGSFLETKISYTANTLRYDRGESTFKALYSGPERILPGVYNLLALLSYMTITVAARSKALTVFVRSNTEIVGSNPTKGMDGLSVFFLCLCCRLRPCDGLIPRPRVLSAVLELRN
jgi:hypothetical protein